MIKLLAKIREKVGKETRKIREEGLVPAILYGPKVENILLEVDLKEFEKVYQEAGGSSLIELEVEGKKYSVLIHAVEIDYLTRQPIHIDFYQPRLDEEIEADVPLVFFGEAPAVKDLGGTLVRNIHQVEVKALPQNLPHEIKIEISVLKTFEDAILIKDLPLPQGVKTLKDPEETIAYVAQPEKVEEELAGEIEEKVEDVEQTKEKKNEE